MIFQACYRASFYLMLLFSTLTLTIGSLDNKVASLFPIATAIAGVLAFIFVDWQSKLSLPPKTTSALGLIAFVACVVEISNDPPQVIVALGHGLVYLQLIITFLPKTIRTDWNLFALGLIQVLIGTVISQSDQVGTMMIIWALLALWVLGLFCLHRESLRAAEGSLAMAVPEWSREEPYPGLFSLSFIFSSIRVMATSLALGGVIFLAMPRRPSAAHLQSGDSVARHLTGFGDEVQLGQLGEILENDTVVMTIKLYDEPSQSVMIPGEEALLWRGVTMEEYTDARWHRMRRSSTTFPNPRRPLAGTRRVLQEIKLESSDSEVLFGLRPMVMATSVNRNRPDPFLNYYDGTMLQTLGRPGAYDYQVYSDIGALNPQPGEQALGSAGKKRLLAIPDALRPRLEEIALKEVAGIPPEDIEGRARAIERYLRDSGQFSYSLRMDVIDPTVDPVEDFLVNRKQGHCEYFASALTLMLRAVGIHARMVNGFKGGDWNDLAQVLSVRQKHAHSWVEAYLGTRGTNSPYWLTLDPTPELERAESVAKVGGVKVNFLQITDLVRYIWVFYIVGYNAERQNRFLYQPVQALIGEARKGYGMLKDATKSTFAKLFDVRDVRYWISFRGFFVSFSVLLVLVGLFRAARWALPGLFNRWNGAGSRAALLTVGTAYYRRMAQLLAECGLERPPAETQAEFARRAYVFLTGRGSATEAVAEVPSLVADAFYRVRFGHLDLGPDDLKLLDARLDELEATLRAGQA